MRMAPVRRAEFDGLQYNLIAHAGDNGLVLGGGRYPMSGPRSNYCAKLCLISHDGSTIWDHEKPKSYPFEKVVVVGETVIASVPSNFVREPCGLWYFDLKSGDLQDVVEFPTVSGLTANDNEAFVFVTDYEAEEARIEKVFPEKIAVGAVRSFESRELQQIHALSTQHLVLTFQQHDSTGFSYLRELHTSSTLEKAWSQSSVNDQMFIAENTAYLYSAEDTCEAIELLDLLAGCVVDQAIINDVGMWHLIADSRGRIYGADNNQQLFFKVSNSNKFEKFDYGLRDNSQLFLCDCPKRSEVAVLRCGKNGLMFSDLSFFRKG